jgi:hypothetical protein
MHSAETTGAVTLLQRLYAKFADEPQEYVAIANLRQPSADLLVITEIGLGVVELKHSSGNLQVRGATWSTEHGPIRAGAESSGYANPRQQVQSYASQIRDTLARYCQGWWSLTEHSLAKSLRVQSAVCFTNPAMTILDEAKTAIISAADADYSRLGRFDLMAPHEFPEWVAALRFEVAQNAAHHYQPYRLEPQHIARLIAHFHGVEWSAVAALMPSDKAYAYLVTLADTPEPQIFSLRTLDLQIGRSASSCALTVPRGYGKVSRIHAQLNRYGDDVWLQDLQSTHGTYVNGVRVGQTVILRPGDRVTLGGPSSGPGVFTGEFIRRLPDESLATETVQERL